MPLKVVHFSSSPLAGAPMRIVAALRAYSGIDAHLVDLDDWGLFDSDVVFDREAEKAVELANKSDIIHLHNCVRMEDERFSPINFTELEKRGKIIVRQYHSPPEAIAKRLGTSVTELANRKSPSMVVAQYHERFFPNARVVPNIVDHRLDIYNTETNDKDLSDIFFGYAIAYEPVGAWQQRWATKAVSEITDILRAAARQNNARANIVCDLPHKQMTLQRSASRIVIDELVTGSYHISALEGLAAGRAVISYLDDRCQKVLKTITGCTEELPFINVAIEHLPEALNYLLNEPELLNLLGNKSRRWFEQYYDAQKLIDCYVSAYNELAENLNSFARQKELAISDKSEEFFSRNLPELIYSSRRGHFNLDNRTIVKKIADKLFK